YQLKVDHRILAYLLGDDAMDARLDDTTRLAVADLPPTLPDSVLEPIYRALANAPMVYMQGSVGSGRRATAASLCQPLVQVDLTRLQTLPIGFERAWELAVREARLIGAGLLLYEWESCLEENGQPPARLWETLLNFERPIFLCGQATWEPHDVNRPRRLLRLNFAVPPKPERQRLWAQYVDSVDPALLDELAGKFRFTPGQIARAVNTAADLATSRGETITMNDLYAGAQAHSSLRLGDMARRIIPRY